MNKLGLAQVLVTLAVSTVLGAMPACYGDVPESTSSEVAEAASPATQSAIVGKWQFVYEGSRRADIEARIDAEEKDPVKRAEAKRAAEKESAASQIELTEDGDFLSWVEGELIFQAAFTAADVSRDTVRLTMKTGEMEKSTTVTLHGADEIVIDDPKKGPLTFRRIQ